LSSTAPRSSNAGDDLDEALAWCARARAQHDRVGDTFQLSRTMLVKGRIRRRRREKRAAREVLAEALASFDGLDALTWSVRAQAELDRTGGRSGGSSELTGTEHEVAELVATGLSNREVASALFISPRTVEANLTSIYRKLRVPSRAALGRRLAELELD
jgi:DNA-binding CsgD family transcriptional regulator